MSSWPCSPFPFPSAPLGSEEYPARGGEPRPCGVGRQEATLTLPAPREGCVSRAFILGKGEGGLQPKIAGNFPQAKWRGRDPAFPTPPRPTPHIWGLKTQSTDSKPPTTSRIRLPKDKKPAAYSREGILGRTVSHLHFSEREFAVHFTRLHSRQHPDPRGQEGGGNKS